MPQLPDIRSDADAQHPRAVERSPLRAAQAGLWRYDGAHLRFSREAARILGIPAADRSPGLPLGHAAAFVHPEDCHAVLAAIRLFREAGGTLRTTFRTTPVAGTVRTVLMQGRFEAGEGGRPRFGHGLVLTLADDAESAPDGAALLTSIELVLAARRTLQAAGPAPSAALLAVDSLLMMLGREVAATLAADTVA
jgi:PAS domain-containing protein